MIRVRHVVTVLIMLCTGLIGSATHAGEVRAWLDRTSIQLGETVTLNVELSGDTRAPQPDFSPLRADFDLLGTQSSTSMNIINGQTSSKLLLAVGLQPKHAGTISVPSFEIAGQKTAALTLTVAAAPAASNAKAGDDVFVEVVAEPNSPYVQEQVRFSVKLYFALNFSDGSLDEPQGEGVVIHKLGQDAYYAADVGGRRYRVWQRRYAMVPEKSGALTIAPVTFRGHAIDPGDVNSFFSRGRAVSAHSEATSFDVRARPSASGTEAWLPARAVTMTASGIDAHSEARVGEPLTLTLHVQAQGLGFEQIPELKLPKIDGADVYPDKTTTQNRDDGEWLYGERERKFAIVPNRAGSLLLPAISLGWWDTARDRAASAEVPPLTLQVLPAVAVAGKPATSAVLPAPAVATAANAVTPGAVEADAAVTARWRNLALASGVLWILTVLLAGGAIVWLRNRRSRQLAPPPVRANSDAGHRTAFLAAARGADWPGAAKALLAWARTSRPGIQNLGSLARMLGDLSQASVASELDRICYGGRQADVDFSARIQQAFAKQIRFVVDTKASVDDALPPLYPSLR